MKLQGLKRVIIEDFKQAEQELVEKFAYVINPLIDNILQALNKGLTFNDNFNVAVVDFNVSVDGAGKPKIDTTLKYDLKTNCKGMQIINIKNLSNSTIYPTQTPFITFEQVSSSLIKIKNISGLVANNNYTITTIIYGS